MKKQVLQIAVLVAVASVLALVSNAMASRQRKLILIGWYPNATTVPVRVEAPPPTTTQPAVPTTTQMSPGPGAPRIEVPTTTIERPAGERPAPAQPAATATQQPSVTQQPATSNQPKVEDVLTRFPAHPDKPYVEISGDDVAWLHARGALFLDARRTSVFEQGHIAGARPFSVWESDIDEKVNNLFTERSDPAQQLQPIVIYCSGGACEDSHMLAQKLWGVQFNNIYVYKDGFPDWQKRAGAVRSGANP